jgi:hypothetical protein
MRLVCPSLVITGLDPVIQSLFCWIPGARPGMTKLCLSGMTKVRL